MLAHGEPTTPPRPPRLLLLWNLSLRQHDGARSAYCISTPSSGKNLSISRNLKEQNTHRSRTAPLHSWGENQSGPLTSTFDQVSAGLGSLSIFLLMFYASKIRPCLPQTSGCLVQLGLDRLPLGGSSHTEHLVLGKPSTKTRKQIRQPPRFRKYRTLVRQHHNPPGGVNTRDDG